MFQPATRLRYDAQCITIDGKDMLIFSGAFHYFRCPRELWADRFRKLKEAGFNTLETYAAWNYHEPLPPSGPDDYSKLDMTELHDWLAMATDQFGFYVILRPGPYICAEWDGGGYPQWLLNFRPKDYKPKEWYRSDDPAYLAWCKHWYAAVAKVAVPFQITHRPPGTPGIILWQIENEYDFSDQPAQVKLHQLDYLAHTSRDLGIDIPLITCVTENPLFRHDDYLRDNVIEAKNTYPKFDMKGMSYGLQSLGVYQPEKFKMITELQGGWFAQVGGQLSEAQGFDAAHINQVTINAWENGFTATNYYMGFGGTNFGDWAAQRLTTTYDYDAPLRECGGTTDRYFAVKALGEFIADHGAALARSVPEPFEVTTASGNTPHVFVRTARGERFIFVRNLDRKQPIKGQIRIIFRDAQQSPFTLNVNLDGFGAKILDVPSDKSTEADGTWYPKPQTLPDRPTNLPTAIEITDIVRKADAGPDDWQSWDGTKTASELGIYNRHYIFYRATLAQPASGTGLLLFQGKVGPYDWAGLSNGEKWIAQAGEAYAGSALDGKSSLTLLYESAGRPNFGNQLEQPCGIHEAILAESLGQGRKLSDWRELHLRAGSTGKKETAEHFDDSAWSKASVDVENGDIAPGKTAVYRTQFELSADELSRFTMLHIGRLDDDGFVFVNGKSVGESHDWKTAHDFSVADALHVGSNTVAVRVFNRDGAGGMSKGVELQPTPTPLAATWSFSQQSQGLKNHWDAESFNDADWQHGGDGDASSLLTWYRLKVRIPATPAGQWIPWHLHLDAVGNGFLYLNGHPLGRWWQVGPQHDYFLPECWLHMGGNATNVIAVEMRPTPDGNRITEARAEPYANMAEFTPTAKTSDR